jgi:hypothetical protein
MNRLVVAAAIAIAALGIVAGAFFLFGPTGTRCSITTIIGAPGSSPTPGPQICESVSLVRAQPIWPMPLIAIAVWSLAPTLTAVGLIRRSRSHASGTGWIVAGIIAECTVLISFGAAPFFLPFVLLPLLVVTALSVVATRASTTGPVG